MSDFCLVDCVNCGKQTEVDLNREGDTCLFCGKDTRKKDGDNPVPKEVIMQDNKETIPVPPKPKNRKKWQKYYEQNKEAIIADYRSMTIRAFLKRWSLATTTWPKLKEKWGVQGKQKRTGPKPTQTIQKRAYKEPQPKPHEFCLLITEEDLARLDDDDFRLIWVVLGRIIKNRLKRGHQVEN